MKRYLTQQIQAGRADRIARSIAVAPALALAVIVASPHLVTAGRAVVNLPTSAAAVVWGRAHDGTCDIQSDLIVTCGSMRSGYSQGGTTVGNVWMYGRIGGPSRHRHESRHADQWAMFGPAFAALYGIDMFWAGGNLKRSAFERWAGLHDGGYVR